MDPTIQALLAAAGSFLLITFIFAAVLVVCKAADRRNHHNGRNQRTDRTRATRKVPNSDLSSISIGESALFDPSLSRVSMAELVTATGNFATDLIIGDGSFGLVYKAKLSTGVTVAVKKLAADAFQGFREFRAEMETLGKIRHENIVRILGYCATGSDRVLIYEFIERGSLDQWLYDTSLSSPERTSSSSAASPMKPLSWKKRISIIRGVAKGLCYLHNLDTAIIHRDIKASNVLLDLDFEAHIADFGLARTIDGSHSHVSTQVAGTMGYMPPEYLQGATIATVAGDVYSFGVLMLEVVTGWRPNWPYKGKDGKEVRLVEWSRRMAAEGAQIKMIDVTIPREGLIEEEILEFFRVAMLCASETPKDRPTMEQVVGLLDGISS